MSKYLQPHQEYMTFKLKILASVNPEALEGYSDIIQMFRHLNFAPAYPLLASCILILGDTPSRKSKFQDFISIFRGSTSCLVQNKSRQYCNENLRSLHKEKRVVFHAIISIESDCLPTIPSFYELSRRLIPTVEIAKLRYMCARKPTINLVVLRTRQSNQRRGILIFEGGLPLSYN